MKMELKIWCQTHHAEALAQLAMYEPAREVLLRDGSVVPALEALVGEGWSKQARELGEAALLALSDRRRPESEFVMRDQQHVMLSCESTTVHRSCMPTCA